MNDWKSILENELGSVDKGSPEGKALAGLDKRLSREKELEQWNRGRLSARDLEIASLVADYTQEQYQTELAMLAHTVAYHLKRLKTR